MTAGSCQWGLWWVPGLTLAFTQGEACHDHVVMVSVSWGCADVDAGNELGGVSGGSWAGPDLMLGVILGMTIIPSGSLWGPRVDHGFSPGASQHDPGVLPAGSLETHLDMTLGSFGDPRHDVGFSPGHAQDPANMTSGSC